MSPLEDWLTAQEAANLSGYHLEHIRRLIRAGELDARKWGKITWMVNRESLLAYMSEMEQEGRKRGPKQEK